MLQLKHNERVFRLWAYDGLVVVNPNVVSERVEKNKTSREKGGGKKRVINFSFVRVISAVLHLQYSIPTRPPRLISTPHTLTHHQSACTPSSTHTPAHTR